MRQGDLTQLLILSYAMICIRSAHQNAAIVEKLTKHYFLKFKRSFQQINLQIGHTFISDRLNLSL